MALLAFPQSKATLNPQNKAKERAGLGALAKRTAPFSPASEEVTFKRVAEMFSCCLDDAQEKGCVGLRLGGSPPSKTAVDLVPKGCLLKPEDPKAADGRAFVSSGRGSRVLRACDATREGPRLDCSQHCSLTSSHTLKPL